MKQLSWITAIALVFLITGCGPSTPTPSPTPTPDPEVELNWSASGPEITPGIADTLIVEDIGLKDTVYVVAGTTLESYSKVIRNTSSNDLTADYQVRVIIQPMLLQIGGDSVQYVVRGDTIYDSVYVETDAIPAGDSSVFTATTGVPTDCGVFKVTMIIDEPGLIDEANDDNNVYVDFINLPSQQQFNVTLFRPDPFIIPARPAGPPAVIPINTPHGYEVTSGGADNAIFASFIVSTFPSCGSGATITPTANAGATPIGGLAAPPVHQTPLPAYVVGLDEVPPRTPNPIMITANVTALQEQCGFAETIFCKATFVSPDGCVLKQKVAQIFVP